VEQRSAEVDDFTTLAKWAAVAFFVTVGVDGIAASLTRGASAPRLLVAVAEGWSLTAWSALDARARSKPYLQIFWLLTLATWPVSAAVHLVRTRGRGGMLTYFIYAMLAVVIYLACRGLGTLVALGWTGSRS
jgi:hypothetical protein